jgi:Staphylococcal nuclease homologue
MRCGSTSAAPKRMDALQVICRTLMTWPCTLSRIVGEDARRALERKVGSAPVSCQVKNKDIYGRNVSVCFGGAQGTEDLNAWMVSEGEAVAYTEYSKSYTAQAQAAEAAKKVHLFWHVCIATCESANMPAMASCVPFSWLILWRMLQGIWNGEFQTPSQWRKENPRSGAGANAMDKPAIAALPPTTEAPDKRCNIKGNINSSGERIYHVPGGRCNHPTSTAAPAWP